MIFQWGLGPPIPLSGSAHAWWLPGCNSDTILLCSLLRYLVTHLMGADMNNIIKTQRLSDDHVQFLVYQVLRAMKVSMAIKT